MGSLSDYAENAVLGHLSTNAAYTPAATVYLALCTADPTDAGTGASMNEVADANGYARTAITFGAPSSRKVTQSANVTYPVATGAQGTVTHWAVLDNGTHGAGNMLAHGAFDPSFVVVSGNRRTIPTGTVYVQIDAVSNHGFTDYAAEGMLNRMFRNQAFTVSNTFASLHTATSSDSTPGTEVSGVDYARVEINENGGASPAWGAVSSGAVSNGALVSFGQPGGAWGTVVSMGIFDAATVGNQLFYDNDNVVDQAIDASATDVNFQVGGIALSLS